MAFVPPVWIRSGVKTPGQPVHLDAGLLNGYYRTPDSPPWSAYRNAIKPSVKVSTSASGPANLMTNQTQEHQSNHLLDR